MLQGAATLARLDRLFDEALRMRPEDRDAFLAGFEAREPLVAASLRDLLAGAAQSGVTSLFEAAIGPWQAAPPVNVPLADLAEGEAVGPYRIIRLIGRGGMAPVYLAERADGVFARQVALKLIPRDLVGPEALGRFDQERQILAHLNHPNIARLFDGGIDARGRSYIAMEYVDGDPIDRYCDEHRLPIDGRIDLFVQVADAVQYAHRNLVIHRDLKPANILVTADGAAKLLDFGIAKLLDPGAVIPHAAPRTRTMFRVLTPGYASPEQLRGSTVTTSSDVYQLGLLLHELLTGVRASDEPGKPSCALDAESADRSAAIAEARRTTPAALARRLRGDLDNIVLKALEADPERRYVSPASLTHDLQSYRRGQPVSARNATTTYRLRKFVRRHKLGVATSVLMACALVAFVATISIQAVKLRVERDLVRLEAAKASEIRDFLVSLFDVPLEVANPTLSARDLIDAAAARVAQIDARQPLVRAQTMHTLAGLYIRLGVYDRARQLAEEALRLRREHVGNDHLDTAESLLFLGMVFNHLEDHVRAESLVREAVGIGERTLGPHHWGVAFALTELGTSVLRQGRPRDAEPIFARAASIYGGHPKKAMGAPTNALGLIRAELGDLEGAIRYYREAIAINVARFGPEHPLVQTNRANLASSLLRLGRASEAEAMLRDVVALRRRALGDEHPDLGAGLALLANAVRTGGDLAAAEALLVEALGIFEKRYPQGHSRITNTRRDLERVRAERSESGSP